MGAGDDLAIYGIKEQYADARKRIPDLTPERFARQCARVIECGVLGILKK